MGTEEMPPAWTAAVPALLTMMSMVVVLRCLRAAEARVVPKEACVASAWTAMAWTPRRWMAVTTSCAGPAELL